MSCVERTSEEYAENKVFILEVGIYVMHYY